MKAYKKIVLAGGNGYLGTVLAKYYKDLADEVIILARKQAPATGNIRTVVWDGKTESGWTVQLIHADMLINLCGKNVNCRYTKKNKAAIIASRVTPTKLLGDVIHKMVDPPKLWINITSATIYRHAEDHPQDETTGEIGYGFSIDVCNIWESTFFKCETPHTRKVALRLGIALGRSGSVFPRLLNLVKMGIGGRQGDGQQYMAWVHEHDVARSTQFLLDQPETEGVYNCAAPYAEKNADFMRLIRKAYGMPVGLPAPQWLLEIGALVIGTEPELILKSRWVKPRRLMDAGFKFQYEKAEYAIHDILSIRG
ncbi:TIGR01777 family oxidoreductase [Mucilaginibacter ginsenosidivorax]|uniref:TIGR01777 family protein n=1 Tax=Mucilaginibacter ginsenosidivorax TaxID=862126 RepID=A0A5B8W0T0_9SPHI|nr:TIGR01777 family oxidoreductase [Mucilaginibacter ginsenosidivorax]QEC77414.1 TIGR01777 family protein [Mucilaginibacter ginsenosidivorax]